MHKYDPGNIVDSPEGKVRIRFYYPPTHEYDIEILESGILTMIPAEELDKYNGSLGTNDTRAT